MIEENLAQIRHSLPDGVVLVAVSKFQPESAIECAYRVGQRVFAESRPQELAVKYRELPKDIEWHMIGHLQTNKVRMIIPFVSLIHSVDSLRLAEVINQEAERCGRVVDVLLEVLVASEQSKFGWTPDELLKALDLRAFEQLSAIRIRGLMGMATFTDDMSRVSSEFDQLHSIFGRVKAEFLPDIDILSMGMSDDYQIAVDHGSTMVRVGSSIFGSR